MPGTYLEGALREWRAERVLEVEGRCAEWSGFEVGGGEAAWVLVGVLDYECSMVHVAGGWLPAGRPGPVYQPAHMPRSTPHLLA